MTGTSLVGVAPQEGRQCAGDRPEDTCMCLKCHCMRLGAAVCCSTFHCSEANLGVVYDCLAMLSAGFDAIAIPSATLLKPEQAKLLKDLTLHIYPDRDKPGERLFLDLKAICPNVVRHQLPEGFKDIGQYYAYLHREDSVTNNTSKK